MPNQLATSLWQLRSWNPAWAWSPALEEGSRWHPTKVARRKDRGNIRKRLPGGRTGRHPIKATREINQPTGSELLSLLRMTPPPPIACEVPGCTFSTEDGIPSHELRIRRLEAHIEMVHKLGKQRPKPSQIPRPELEEDASEEEWGHFLVKWKRYKRSCLQGMTKTDMVDHLWACCPKELESAIMKQVGTFCNC